MSEEMSNLAKNQAEANSSRLTSDAEMLKKMHEMIATESQAAVHSTLEQTNEQLLANLMEINAKFAAEKEAHSSSTTRLALELQHSEQRVAALQRHQGDLERQTGELQQDKMAITISVAALELELDAAKTQLNRNRAMLKELQDHSASQVQAYSLEASQLQALNQDLQAQLGEVRHSNEALNGTVASYDQSIERLERDIVPNLEASLETERDTVARMEAELETHLTQLEESRATITRFQLQVEQWQQRNEEESCSFRLFKEGSQNAIKTMTLAAVEMDRQIVSLTRQLEQLQLNTAAEQQRLADVNASLQHAFDTLVAEQKQLNDALEESMVQLDRSELEKKELEKKLSRTLKMLDQANAMVDSKDSETARIVEGMTNQVAEERTRRERAEARQREVEVVVSEKDQHSKGLEKQIKQTTEDRDMARNNMQGFDEREENLYKKLRESDRVRREMHSRIMQLMGNIRVFVRVRPPLPGEADKERRRVAATVGDGKKRKRDDDENETALFRFPGVYDDRDAGTERSSSGDDLTKNLIVVTEPYKHRGGLKERRKQWRFGFDSVFSPAQGQEEIWEATEPLIQCAVDGFNVTVFAYGQTGSGVRSTVPFLFVRNEHPGCKRVVLTRAHILLALRRIENVHNVGRGRQ